MAARKRKTAREFFPGSDRRVRDCLRQAFERAASGEPLLILGPSGCGKSLLAETAYAACRGDALETMACAAVPVSGQARELRRLLSGRPGVLLVKEICALSPAAQALLARFLLSGEGASYRPRLVCTTSRDFQAAGAAGKIIGPLFHGLRGRTVALPPVSSRKKDLLPLIKALAPRPLVFTKGAVRELRAYEWPGNVRELERFLRIAACRGRRLDAAAVRDCLTLNFF